MVFFTWVLTIIIVAGAVGAVLARNLMHSALSLGLSLAGIAGMFLLLRGDFLAAVQVTVYVSGVLVLILFVVMLTQRLYDKSTRQTNEQWGPALVLALVVFTALCWAVLRGAFDDRQLLAYKPTVEKIGRLLLTTYVVPFEVASVLLLAAMIGAILLTRREPPPPEETQ